MGYGLFENARKTKINFNQLAGKNRGSGHFQVHFCLLWPFKAPEYTSSIVTFSKKVYLHDFPEWIFAFLDFIFSINSIFGISGCLRWTNNPKNDQNNPKNTEFKNKKACYCAFKNI